MNELRKGIAAAAVDGIVVPEPETATRHYRFSADFIGFSGHFPGDPILPAIAQIGTVVSLAEEHSGRPLRLAAVEFAKFLSPIRPRDEVRVRYQRRADAGRILYDATLSVDGKTAAAFLLDLADEGEPR
ncbi:MAG: 3-hydroxyacyl-ACP dehydratase FabZ family protein [Candidatus Deferrimicrobiaceae bacterium]